MIANLGCEMAMIGIASAADVDTAMTLGLNYPRGPLALADWLGVKECHEILVQLQAITGDDRYRPSQWLRRRAHAGHERDDTGVGHEADRRVARPFPRDVASRRLQGCTWRRWALRHSRSRFAQSWIALEHIPSGRNWPDGICLLQPISPVRAFPFRWNRASWPMG